MFKIHLYANESLMIGKTHLHISTLMKKENFDLNTKPILIDEVLTLTSQKQVQIQNKDEMPVVGIQVILRKEDSVIDGLIINQPQEQQQFTENIKFNNNNSKHDESTPKKSENNSTPNLTPIKSHFNEEIADCDHNKDDQFLRTPSPVTVQHTTITKHVNQPAPGAPPVSAKYYFENNEKSLQRQPSVNENVHNEELQLRAAYEIQLWKEAREKEFDQYVSSC